MEISDRIRNIPQILRYYIIINNIRSMPIDSLMEHCDNYPLLVKIKRMLLHDKDRAVVDIDRYINDIYNDRFYFLYNIKGVESDWNTIWPEDLARSKWNKFELIGVLRQLKDWVIVQKPYRYPVEIED